MKKVLKWFGIFLGLVIVGLGGLALWIKLNVQGRLQKVHAVAPVELAVAKADTQLGEHIVKVRNGCVDCHGPDLAGNKVMDNPAMGLIAGPNITPATLGRWSDGEIARAIRHGIGQKGQALVLMPSHDYQYLSQEDLAATVAYLRTVAPVEKPSAGVRLGPVAHVLIATGQAPTFLPAEIIDHNAAFHQKPKEDVSAAFGKYLAQTSCMGCHNPNLSGGKMPGGPPDWPPASDLTKAGIGSWKEADFIKTMRTGVNPQGHKLRDPMPVGLTAQMTDTELKALWMYLITL